MTCFELKGTAKITQKLKTDTRVTISKHAKPNAVCKDHIRNHLNLQQSTYRRITQSIGDFISLHDTKTNLETTPHRQIRRRGESESLRRVGEIGPLRKTEVLGALSQLRRAAAPSPCPRRTWLTRNLRAEISGAKDRAESSLSTVDFTPLEQWRVTNRRAEVSTKGYSFDCSEKKIGVRDRESFVLF